MKSIIATAPNGHSVFTPRAPIVHPERVLRIQGYSDLERVRPAILKAAVAMTELAPQLSTPEAAYRRVSVASIHDGVVELDGGVRLHCKAFDRALRGCTEVVVFALTVGAKLDERVMELLDAGDLLEALLLETTGWLCIEDATRQFKVHIREESMVRGYRITSRLGPGYSYKVEGEMCSWNLEEQRTLFGTFNGAKLPVSLLTSCAMQPKMSRSGLFGVGPSSGGRSNSHAASDFDAVSTT
jgi:hypothetical protein